MPNKLLGIQVYTCIRNFSRNGNSNGGTIDNDGLGLRSIGLKVKGTTFRPLGYSLW